MKKSHIKGRFMAMAAAAAMTCSFTYGTLPVSAAETSEPVLASQSEEPVIVMVRLSGEALFASDEAKKAGIDYIDTPEADEIIDGLREAQQTVEDAVRQIYPELEIRHRYTLALNGFSCAVPENLIGEIEKMPLVESVSPVKTTILKNTPKMAYADDLTGAADFRSSTGSYGEGEVIAIIDSEFDLTNDMFAPLTDKETAISKEDVAAIAGKEGFSNAVDPEQAYVSSKVPFAYDYADDTPYILGCEANYHGTHVSGIAAGNEVTTADGKTISGIAKDAQLVLMKTSPDLNGGFTPEITDEVISSAIEDCIKLKVDVINMSFGTLAFENEDAGYNDAMKAAVNAGITICVSAGNYSDNISGNSGKIDTRYPDRSTVEYPAVFSDSFTAASADNVVFDMNHIVGDGIDIPYCECSGRYCIEALADKEYEVTAVDYNAVDKMKAENIKDKVVCFTGSSEEFDKFVENCTEFGAVGIIIAGNTNGQFEMRILNTDIPAAIVEDDNMSKFLASSPKTIKFTGSSTITQKDPQTLSFFSSFGAPSSLDLKPEITGIGSHILSAGYNKSYKYMSGTSMSSPYTAGCSAIVDEYLKKNGMLREGIEKSTLIKNIMMNTAKIYTDSESGLPISPRKQGAGVIDLSKVENTKVLLTGDSGYAKFELRDKLTDTISFDITLTNISKEDVTFSKSDIIITTDGWRYDEKLKRDCITDSVKLSSTDDLDDTITVKAGETVKKTVTINLDSQQTSENLEIFKNGFFVEGYVTLSGAENCCDISAPLLGFYGDWAKVPNIYNDENTQPVPLVNIGRSEIRTDHKISEFISKIEPVFEKAENIRTEDFISYLCILPKLEKIDKEAYEEAVDTTGGELTYLAPDGDSSSEYIGYSVISARDIKFTGTKLFDDKGNLISVSEPVHGNRDAGYILAPDTDMKTLKEGRYSMETGSYINYSGASEAPQMYRTDFEVDKTPPAVKYNITEKDGRKILNITATDKNLDGIYIAGEKKGEMSKKSEAVFQSILSARHALGCHPDMSLVNNMLAYKFETQDLYSDEPYVLHLLNGEDSLRYYYNYYDVIPAEPDANGTYSLSYDITDLREYSICVLDRALNYGEVMESKNYSVGMFANTLWRLYNYDKSKEHLIRFIDESKCTLIDEYDNSSVDYTYTFKDNTLTLTNDKLNKKEVFSTSWYDRYDGSVNCLSGSLKDQELYFSVMDKASATDYDFLSNKELEELAKDLYERLNGVRPEYASSVDYIDNSVMIFLSSDTSPLASYHVFRDTGYCFDGEAEGHNLLEGQPLRCGTWEAITTSSDENDMEIMIFNDDNTGVIKEVSNGFETAFTYEYQNGDNIVLTLADGTVKTASVSYSSIKNANLILEDDHNYSLTYLSDTKNIGEIKFFTKNEIMEMAKEYYTASTGNDKIEVSTFAVYPFSLSVTIKDTDTNENLTVYSIDVFNGKGTDSDGYKVDLTKKKLPASLGDVNSDGQVNASDASAVLMVYAALSTGKTPDIAEEQLSNADVNADGSVNASDASVILAYYSYLSTGGEDTIQQFADSYKTK